MRRTLVLLLLAGSFAACTLKEDAYPPTMAAARRWNNDVPYMLQAHSPTTLLGEPLCPVALPATSAPRPGLVPAEGTWAQWRRAPEAKTLCTGKGKHRRCTKETLSTVERAKAEALVKPSRRYLRGGASGMYTYPYTPGADQIFEVHAAMRSPTYLLLPPGERLAGMLKVDPDFWEASPLEQGAGRQRKETVILRAVDLGPEVITALQLVSGHNIWLKLVATENAGMVSVTWAFPQPPPTSEDIPIAERPPTIDRERLHTDYRLTVQGTLTPPWLPAGAFDDGRRTFLYFREPLTATSAPAVWALDQKGKPVLTQSQMFIPPAQSGDQGAYLLVPGLVPALKLKDATGIEVLIERQNPPLTQKEAYATP